MKKLLLVVLIACAGAQVKAQKWEISVQGGTTVSYFSGDAATTNAGLVEGSNAHYYTDNPYGKKKAFGYSGGLQGQWISKGGFIAGLGAGYELLRSKTLIDKFYPMVYYTLGPYPAQALTIYAPQSLPANGSVYLSNRFINLSPYVGYRVKFTATSLDILPGMDIAIPLSSSEKGSASDNLYTYTANNKLTKPLTDVRVKLGAAFNYRRFSLNVAYAFGVLNYDRNYIGATPNLHSELYRLGVGYRLN